MFGCVTGATFPHLKEREKFPAGRRLCSLRFFAEFKSAGEEDQGKLTISASELEIFLSHKTK